MKVKDLIHIDLSEQGKEVYTDFIADMKNKQVYKFKTTGDSCEASKKRYLTDILNLEYWDLKMLDLRVKTHQKIYLEFVRGQKRTENIDWGILEQSEAADKQAHADHVRETLEDR